MKKLIYITLVTLLFSSCVIESNEIDEPDGKDSDIVSSLSVEMNGTRGESEQDNNIEDNNEDESDNSYSPVYIIDKFEEGSILYIAQRAPDMVPKFASVKPDVNFKSNPYYGNLYVYEYKENPEANWSENDNFFPYVNSSNNSNPIDWSTIRKNGAISNAYSFYAMYFPNNNQNSSTTESWGSREWQNTSKSLEELIKTYDIMGAYHATTALYTRLRFRLHHLMLYLKVILYVPVYDGSTSTGFGRYAFDGNKEANTTSYADFPGVWVSTPDWDTGSIKRSMIKEYTIAWNSPPSSDGAPLVSPTSGSMAPCMFLSRQPKDDNDWEPIDVSRYYTGDNALTTDKVYRFEFSAIFPAQNIPGNNILCMRLLPGFGPGEYKGDDIQNAKYTVYRLKQDNPTLKGGELHLTEQGTFQQIELYLPRRSNEPLMVGAKVLKWNEVYTDMTLVKDESKNQENPND